MSIFDEVIQLYFDGELGVNLIADYTGLSVREVNEILDYHENELNLELSEFYGH